MKAIVSALFVSLVCALTASAGGSGYESLPQLIEGRVPRVSAGAEGWVTLAIRVAPQGHVAEISIRESTDIELADACVHAVKSWQYAPAFKSGKPASATLLQKFRFGDPEPTRHVYTDDRRWDYPGRPLTSFEPKREPTPQAVALDRVPSPVRTVSPELPNHLRDARGRVAVVFDVKDSGEVASVEVRETTQPEITSPILEAARQWTFSPAVKNGKPVGSKVLVPFLVGTE